VPPPRRSNQLPEVCEHSPRASSAGPQPPGGCDAPKTKAGPRHRRSATTTCATLRNRLKDHALSLACQEISLQKHDKNRLTSPSFSRSPQRQIDVVAHAG
jgi:hypothetical protein